jgi:glycosyltransferase involved in cell wall biosynthesis
MATQAQLAVAYASADLFIFPSLTETFGNVTLEALASGTPVLAFDCAAAKEVIEDELNGWLVPGEDAQRYVLRALAVTQKTSTLQEARLNASTSIRQWEWSSIATKVENQFRQAMTDALTAR